MFPIHFVEEWLSVLLTFSGNSIFRLSTLCCAAAAVWRGTTAA